MPTDFPFLAPAPTEIAMVDLKTGMVSMNWRPWFENLQRVVFGVWRTQVYNAADFTTINPGITWNTGALSLQQLTIYQQGPLAIVFFFLTGTTVSADIDILKIRIPTLRAASDPTLNAFQNTVVAHISPAATVLAEAYVVNLGTASRDPVQIQIELASGADFLAASANIRIQGCVAFQCQAVLVP